MLEIQLTPVPGAMRKETEACRRGEACLAERKHGDIGGWLQSVFRYIRCNRDCHSCVSLYSHNRYSAAISSWHNFWGADSWFIQTNGWHINLYMFLLTLLLSIFEIFTQVPKTVFLGCSTESFYSRRETLRAYREPRRPYLHPRGPHLLRDLHESQLVVTKL